MNKEDLVKAIAEVAGITKVQAGKSLDAFVACVCESLVRGEDIRISGLGSFSSVQTQEKSGRNPRTGEKITIPSKKKVTFRTSDSLSKAMNGQQE